MPDADASRKRQISGRRIPGSESSLYKWMLEVEAETSGRAFRLRHNLSFAFADHAVV
jgi:hypothetical protein